MLSAKGFAATWKFIGMFRDGLICTVSLSALTVFFGFILALFLAVMRLSDFRPFRALGLTKDGKLRENNAFLSALSRFNPISFVATVYVEVFRATPMLVQLFIIYYIVFAPVKIPTFKLFGFIRFERFLPGVVALAMNSGAYLCEIIRAGITSIDPGQMEAGRALGLSYWRTMLRIILPQAIRNVLPALGNEFIVLMKDTSIVGYIALIDLAKGGDIIRSQTYSVYLPYLTVAAIYLVLVMTFTWLLGKLERHLRNTGADVVHNDS